MAEPLSKPRDPLADLTQAYTLNNTGNTHASLQIAQALLNSRDLPSWYRLHALILLASGEGDINLAHAARLEAEELWRMKWERGYRDAEGVFQKALVKARKDLDGLMFVMCEEEVRAGVVGWEEASEGDLMVLADLGAGDGSKREGIFASKKDEGGEELVNDWTFVEKPDIDNQKNTPTKPGEPRLAADQSISEKKQRTEYGLSLQLPFGWIVRFGFAPMSLSEHLDRTLADMAIPPDQRPPGRFV